MAEKTISIQLKGYWQDENKGSIPIPSKSGVYCVYEWTPRNVKEEEIGIQKLIYIGESENVNKRIAEHITNNDWLKYVKGGNKLCFSFGEVDSEDRNRAEAALIFKHKPPENEEYKDSFPFDKTTISLSGESKKLTTNFTLDRT